MKNKRIKGILFTICVMLLVTGNYTFVYADNGNVIVHVTKTGDCYHNANCGHLRSDIIMTLYEAVVEKGYNPCSDCNPPIYDGPFPTSVPMEKKSSTSTYKNATTNTEKRAKTESENATSQGNNKQSQTKNNSINGYWLLAGIVVVIVGFSFVPKVGEVTNNRKKHKEEQEKKRLEKIKWEEERQKFREIYEGIDPITLVDVPNGSFIKDNLPYSLDGNGIYGCYTVYTARKGSSVFHTNPRCSGNELYPVNYVLVNKRKHCQKCAMGNIILPRVSWYHEYCKIVDIKSRYMID